MLIEFKDVGKTYKDGNIVALRSVNLSLEKGSFVFVVGPSGAGKSTLLKLIYMDELPSKGEVRVGEYTSSSVSDRDIAQLRRKVGVVFQDFRLLPDLTAFENVVLPLRAAGRKWSDIRKRANSVLYTVGLSTKRHQYPRKLSGGEQQRVAIARAIALRPAVLIADEPTGNLDPGTSERIFDHLLDINRAGASVLVATHDHRHAQRLEKRVIRIEGGRIASDGSASECIT